MAIKMRILYASGKKKIQAYANAIKAQYELAFNSVDVIPPAYSCDRERIVILCIRAYQGARAERCFDDRR